MRYLYHPQSGAPTVTVAQEQYRYLFKVRRHQVGDEIALRNLQDDNLYLYRVVSIAKKEALLELTRSKELVVAPQKSLHLGWCMVDPKTIEKALPSLNEIGVSKITLIYCQYSQKQFKPGFDRLRKILLTSMQQSGRSVWMELDLCNTLEAFLQTYPNAYALDFGGTPLEGKSGIETVVIGCEGGFSNNERALFQERIVGFESDMVLRSESAACAASAKLLL